MKNSKHKYDLILIFSSLIFSLILGSVFYFKKGNSLMCQITDCNNNQVVYKLSEETSSERELLVEGVHEDLKVGISKNGVRVIEANCPHQDCIKTGTIKFKGQSIICLHNKVVIKLIDTNKEDIYL